MRKLVTLALALAMPLAADASGGLFGSAVRVRVNSGGLFSRNRAAVAVNVNAVAVQRVVAVQAFAVHQPVFATAFVQPVVVHQPVFAVQQFTPVVQSFAVQSFAAPLCSTSCVGNSVSVGAIGGAVRVRVR